MKRVLALLGVITFIAVFLRLFNLGKTPIALEWDEVALGYDAYSIIQTGRDQFGHFLPINFRSLDDWKPPLYVYSAIPGIFLFGLNDFTVRLPSAVFGSLAVILVFFLVREFFQERPEKNPIALLSALFLAISPWHLQFSRAAFETNLSVTVTSAAVLCFLIGIRKRNFLFPASAALFGLCLFSYHSTRVVTPLLLMTLLILLRKQLPGKKVLIGFFSIYFVFWLFFIPIAVNRDAQIRFIVTNDLKVEANQSRAAGEIALDLEISHEAYTTGRFFHNRRFSIYNYENLKRIIANYFSHFSPEFLVVEGDAPLHHAPGFGMVYFFDYIFIISGLGFFILKYAKRKNLILPLWLFLAPLPASVTWQSPHSVRSEIILPTLQVFAALGIWNILIYLKKEWDILFKAAVWAFLPVFIFSFGKYLHQYYFHTNYELSRNWIYGRRQAVEYTESLKANYDKVLVSLGTDMPHIFWLYYTQYPPRQYLSMGGTVSGGFADERNKFDKYEFRNFKYYEFTGQEKYLLVGPPRDFPTGARILKTIRYLDGSIALQIAENLNE